MIDETLSQVARELFQAHYEQCFLTLLPDLTEIVKVYDLIALYAAAFVDVERDRDGTGRPAHAWEAHEYWRYQITAVTSDNQHIFAGTLSSLFRKLQAYTSYAQLPSGPVAYDFWDVTSRSNIDTIIAFPLVFEIRQTSSGVITHDWSFQKL